MRRMVFCVFAMLAGCAIGPNSQSQVTPQGGYTRQGNVQNINSQNDAIVASDSSSVIINNNYNYISNDQAVKMVQSTQDKQINQRDSNDEKDNIAVSFLSATGGPHHEKYNFHLSIYFPPASIPVFNRFSLGIEAGKFERIVSNSYNTLPGFTVETKKEDLCYAGLSTRYFLRTNRKKNPAPYIGIVINAVENYQLIAGCNLKTFGNFILGLESRFVYYESEVCDIIFNKYGDAINDPKKEYVTRIISGIVIGHEW